MGRGPNVVDSEVGRSRRWLFIIADSKEDEEKEEGGGGEEVVEEALSNLIFHPWHLLSIYTHQAVKQPASVYGILQKNVGFYLTNKIGTLFGSLSHL